MGLPYTPNGFERFCSLLEIDDQGGTGRIPFAFNAGQRALSSVMCAYSLIMILKARQMGITTEVLAADLAFCVHSDISGRPAECAFVIDKADKAKKKIDLVEMWCNRTGIPGRRRGDDILFPNGSALRGVTAGAQDAVRSDSLKRVHITEWPFWAKPQETFQDIMSTLGTGDNVSVVIETTYRRHHPFVSKFWSDANDFAKVFLPFSLHETYHRPDLVDKLLPSEIEMLTAEGFGDKMAAGAGWLWMLQNKMGGDLSALKNEFPERPEHCFAKAEGRWVLRDPETLGPLDIVTVESVNGTQSWELEVYVHPEDVRGRCIVAVDTAEGVGQDRSVVLVVDMETGRICACFASEWCAYDDLARVAGAAFDHFTISPGAGKRRHRHLRPELVVEKNGPGYPTVRELRKSAYPAFAYVQDESTKYRGLVHAKREVEAGRAYGPYALVEDCRDCHKDGSRWKGRKDVLVSLGFAHCHTEADKKPLVEGDGWETAAWSQYRDRLRLGESGTLF